MNNFSLRQNSWLLPPRVPKFSISFPTLGSTGPGIYRGGRHSASVVGEHQSADEELQAGSRRSFGSGLEGAVGRESAADPNLVAVRAFGQLETSFRHRQMRRRPQVGLGHM